MDIFSDALTGLGIDVQFDHDNLFSCSLAKDNDDAGLLLSAYRDTESMSLRLSIMTRNGITDRLDTTFWTEFAQMAMGPFRDEVGIGILDRTNKIAIYYSFQLSGQPQGHAMKIIEQLTETAEYWDEKLKPHF